ncbi:hypothetical protein [Erysipelothrix anatis]|uniref:hypothetical protein n=1 Tax=Erysipelothrix anatis TaxID=2683713 RepID=UPI001407D3B1|nr:hypothetical protein [Erysipelothrix anatis]
MNNEQRAHDLACSMIDYVYKSRIDQETDRLLSEVTNPKGDNNIEIKVDIMDVYMDLYESALNGFNKRFK